MADPIDTDDLRKRPLTNVPTSAYPANWVLILTPDERDALCDEVDRLRAENAALADALADIAGMQRTHGDTHDVWVAFAECASMGERRCWEHLGLTDGGPEEWCPVCVAEVAWCAWRMGVLR